MSLSKRPGHQAGFTLVEILIVVFIIGLLATIVSVNVIGRTDDARRTKAIADLKMIQNAVHMYKLDNGYYPTTEQGIEALIRKPSSGPQPRKYPPEGYLDTSKPPEDPWGGEYVYISDGRQYVLRSLGADREQGGDGYDSDLDSRDVQAN